MNHPVVHPMEIAPQLNNEPGAENAAGVRMRDKFGMPGTPSSLIIRLCQFCVCITSVGIMASSDFMNVEAFSYLVAAASLHSLWSLFVATVHIYALLVGRRLQNFRIAVLFTIGDGIISTLTFTAACASAGMTILLHSNMDDCAKNHCGRLMLATALAFISWFPFTVLLLSNFWISIKTKRR